MHALAYSILALALAFAIWQWFSWRKAAIRYHKLVSQDSGSMLNAAAIASAVVIIAALIKARKGSQ